jgi:hypothetical protein
MPSDKDETGPGRLLGICKEIMRERFASQDPGGERDMLGSFIRHGLSQKDAVTEATLQM